MVMLVLFGVAASVIAVWLVRAATRYLESVAAFAAALDGCPSLAPGSRRRTTVRQAFPVVPIPGWRRSGQPLHH